MTISLCLIFLLALSCAITVQTLCTSNLLIDNYSRYALHLNALGQFTSGMIYKLASITDGTDMSPDDGTTRNLTVDVANKKISFDAIAGSYFYSRFDCETAASLGYSAISFPIRGPVEASFELELQTAGFCPVVSYTSYYYKIPNEMTEEVIVVTVPLKLFTGANLDALNSIVFGGFTPGIWEIGSTELVCANVPPTSVNGSATASSTSSTVLPVTNSGSSTTSSSSLTVASISSPTQLPSPPSSSASFSPSQSSSFNPGGVTSPSHTTSSTTASSPIVSPSVSSCSSLLIDDFSSQYRLAVLCQNALLQPSSDDNSMKKVAVANNHVTLFPVDSHSYFYTSFGCLNATSIYGGIDLTISAPVHTVIVIEFRTSSTCNPGSPSITEVSSKDLSWSFDATERVYRIPLAKIPALDTDHLMSLQISGFRNVVTLGSITFYCTASAAYGA